LTDGADERSSGVGVGRVGCAGWQDTVAFVIYKSVKSDQRGKQRRTEVAALLGTPVGSTETTSGPGRTDTVGAAVLVVILTTSDGFEDITSILSGPLLPKFGGSSRHRGREEGLRSSRSSEGGKGEGEESEGNGEFHHDD
jgi:hypothetical protein